MDLDFVANLVFALVLVVLFVRVFVFLLVVLLDFDFAFFFAKSLLLCSCNLEDSLLFLILRTLELLFESCSLLRIVMKSKLMLGIEFISFM